MQGVVFPLCSLCLCGSSAVSRLNRVGPLRPRFRAVSTVAVIQAGCGKRRRFDHTELTMPPDIEVNGSPKKLRFPAPMTLDIYIAGNKRGARRVSHHESPH